MDSDALTHPTDPQLATHALAEIGANVAIDLEPAAAHAVAEPVEARKRPFQDQVIDLAGRNLGELAQWHLPFADLE